MHLFDKCAAFTRAREAQAVGMYPYFQRITESQDTEVVIDGHRKVMIGSNNYMGLTHHPLVLEAAREALEVYGSGNTGSRFLNGNLDIHDLLEDELADFTGKEAALVFSTGYQTNLGAISALVGRGDTVYLDKLGHACLQDGARLSFGQTERFRHEDYSHLENLLEATDPDRGKLVVVDGVYSMEGDIVNLPDLVPLVKKYDAALLVDDAHSLGVLGPHGEGTAAHWGMTDEVDLITGTFSKSLASIGGFVAGDDVVIHYLRNHARTEIFSASMPPSAVATVRAALQIIRDEPERRTRLWEVTHRMMAELTAMGYEIGPTQTPIIPLLIGPMDVTFQVWRHALDAGVFTNPVVPPAVPEGGCRLRTSFMATHTDEQLDFVLDILEQAGKKYGVL